MIFIVGSTLNEFGEVFEEAVIIGNTHGTSRKRVCLARMFPIEDNVILHRRDSFQERCGVEMTPALIDYPSAAG
jgi:hypothetical protein